MYYVFGYDQVGYWVYQTAILPADGRGITVVCRGADLSLVGGLPFVEDIRTWLDVGQYDPAQITADALRSLRLIGPGHRIGIELKSHALLPYYFERLRGLLNDCVIVDASDLITELRLRKSTAEIAYVYEAARVQDVGYAATFATVTERVRECDVLAATMGAMLAAGGDMPAIATPIASGPRTLSGTHGAATERVLRRDEPFCIELGASYRRYHVVGAQAKWLGRPPRPIRDDYEVLLEALSAGVSSARPGAYTAEVARQVQKVRARYDPTPATGKVGYGTGIGYPPTWLDNLRVQESDQHVLEPGTLLFMYVGKTTAVSGTRVTLYVGEPILVTASGPERLSRIPLTLDLP
jgi:Xaa-Pro dipeptidase